MAVRGPAAPESAEGAGYERHFGLREPPFTLTANPQFAFASRSYQGGLDEIVRAIERHEPLLVVTGVPGSGKTLVCRTVAGWRDARTFVATISIPALDSDDLLRLILDEFGVMPHDSHRSAEAGHFELVRTLQQFLESLAALNARAVIVIDDAHRLSTLVLLGLRSLIDFETNTKKLLQIVLLGEPVLLEQLASPDLSALDQRVTRRFVLEPLTAEEVPAYIEHRLSVARTEAPASPELTRDALDAVSKLSGGVPRVVNLLCDRALETACTLGVSSANLPVVIAAAKGLGMPVPLSLRTRRYRGPLAAAAVLIACVGLAGWWFAFRDGTSIPQSSQGGTPQAAATPPRAAQAAAPSGLTALAEPTKPVESAKAAGPIEGAGRVEPLRSSEPPGRRPSREPVEPIEPVEPVEPIQPAASARQGASSGFLVIASSFRTPERAGALSERVQALGLPARVRSASGWHQVVVGPYPTREGATDARETMQEAGIEGALITQGGANAAPAVVSAKPGAPPPARPASKGIAERAQALVQEGDVRGILRLRDEEEDRLLQQGRSVTDVQDDLKLFDTFLEAARRRRLELDGAALGQRD